MTDLVKLDILPYHDNPAAICEDWIKQVEG